MTAKEAQERLNGIWRDHLDHGGPRRPITDAVVAETRVLYAKLEDPESRVATATMFRRRGIEVGEHPPLVALRFQPDWDGEEAPAFDGYTDGRTWNGWEAPYVTAEALATLCAEMTSASHTGSIVWALDGDTLVVSGYGDEEPERVTPTLLATVDGEKLLWHLDIGLCFIRAKEVE